MDSLSFTVSDNVATLAIQRTQVSNAIDITIIRAMHLALDQIQKGESGAKAVVITGSNDVFCSGLDLHSVDLKTQEARQRAHFEMRRFMDPLILRLSGFRFPIMAAVNGAATMRTSCRRSRAWGWCLMRGSHFTSRAASVRAAPYPR
jgi:enoyl-CoA hydratase/carnithine racemase